ncbi:MAG: hypothetical protein BGP04_08910 [Rhizobiales bacterium 62-17]|nr:tripartite tricarboxylate transporter substrate binding protein [Hyphomicrobiales bacterium]OJY05487.1 MAG: hypothetical protein BGP04_08910 [Rhizobiales bacterium 62-17]
MHFRFALALLLALTGTAAAQTWPDRPVRIIVSQSAGGTPDIVARLVADRLSTNLKQQFIIENRAGAANILGTQAGARSAPDGYTFLFATAAALASNPHTFATLPYDPVKDFAPVAMIAKGPFFLLVNSSVPAKTLPELIALQKASPGTLSIATDGPRNFTGILIAWLDKLAGAQSVQVPYQVVTQGIQDTIEGRVQMIALPITSAVPFIESKQLRPLAVSSIKPMPKFETIPPIAQTLPGVDMIGWFALVAPTGTPDTIIQSLNKEVARILDAQDMKDRLIELGFFTEGAGTPTTTGDYIAAQRETWGRVVKAIELPPLAQQ